MAAHPIVVAKRRRVIQALAEGRPQTKIAADGQISRQTVRHWQARYKEYGDDWLLDRVPRRRPAMPNQTPLEDDGSIFLNLGDRPSDELRLQRGG